MSKTDKDRPYAIRAFFEGDLNHYHGTSGECFPEEFRHVVAPRRRWSHKCERYETFSVPCPGFAPEDRYTYSAHENSCYTMKRRYNEAVAEIELLPWTERSTWMHPWRKRRYCGTEHTERVYHRDWACAICDDIPTCHHTLGWRERPYRHVPRWYTHANWYGPERVRERDKLREMAKAYNAGDDLEDSEFVNSQHRHGASWDYY